MHIWEVDSAGLGDMLCGGGSRGEQGRREHGREQDFEWSNLVVVAPSC